MLIILSSKDIFEEYDTDKDQKLTLNQCAEMFEKLSKKATSLPAVRYYFS